MCGRYVNFEKSFPIIDIRQSVIKSKDIPNKGDALIVTQNLIKQNQLLLIIIKTWKPFLKLRMNLA